MILGIYGAGGLGREVLELARQINYVSPRWDDILFIDDVTTETVVNGASVIRFADILDGTEVIIGIGEPAARQSLANKIAGQYPLATLIHPDVFIPDTTRVGEGCIISSGAFVSCNVAIGRNTLLQPKSCVGHDCVIGEHSVISSLVTVAGACHVGDRVFVGMNSTIKEKTPIGDDAIVGMGSAVFNAVAAATIVLGNPARAMRNNDQGKVFKSSPQR